MKRNKKRGRPKIGGQVREPNGRISRAKAPREAVDKLAIDTCKALRFYATGGKKSTFWYLHRAALFARCGYSRAIRRRATIS